MPVLGAPLPDLDVESIWGTNEVANNKSTFGLKANHSFGEGKWKFTGPDRLKGNQRQTPFLLEGPFATLEGPRL